ncbi:hypothetical protein EZI54_02380 [Marinobacter halodurans]|uniref:RHS repeat protein n=1 Tax=Marinobacter halodurans TaxID=2528979 RepID=A0ABY1ZPU0_9GAMM|nr:hypothetical protein [Marinobacter halodurans]TBW58737.1 hypothetical protein EZI54_02380 [Marinobacter halodurans]
MTVRAVRINGSVERKAGIRALTLAVAPLLVLASHPALAERTWNYTYTDSGQLETIDGPRTDVNDITTFTYDSTNNLIAREDALGHTTQFADYTALGLPQQITDPNGVVTTLTYDWRGHVTSRDIQTGSGTVSWTYTYDPVGQLTSITQPNGQTLTYVYDAARRLTSVTLASVGSIEFEYDAMGNVTAKRIKDTSGVVANAHTQAFDELGRLIRSIQADGDTTRYGYDVNSNLTSVTDANSQETTRAYDALDRLTQVTDPLQGQVTFTYDSADNLTSVTDQRGLKTTYEYNFAGDVTALHSPDTGTTTYTYDDAGNQIQKTDARGVISQYTYDAMNRLTSIAYPASSEENIQYTYDDTTNGNYGIGRLTGIVDRTGETHYTYDALGRVVKDARTIETTQYVTTYQYNDIGQPTVITYPSGRILQYGYGADGKLQSIITKESAGAEAQTVVDQLAYKPFGPLSHMVYGNGLARDVTYNQDYELTAIQSGVLDLGYSYDAVGNIESINDYLDTGNSETFFYDAKNQLTDATGPYGDIDYSYDPVGNRLTRNILKDGSTQAESYTYASDSNRLLEVASDTDGVSGSRTFAYTDAGNVSQDATSTDTRSLIYNARNRLEEVQEDGATNALYLYNAMGQRVVKVAQDPASNLHFQYDLQGHLIAESQPDGTVVREYVYVNDQPVAVLSNDGSSGSAELIIDNTDSRTSSTGSWSHSSTETGFYGDDYQWALSGDGSAAFHWQPGLTETATYTVYARWTAYSNRASDATYTVTSNGVQHQSIVDQRSNGGTWQSLGTFALGTDAEIALSNDANGTVIADAVKLVPSDSSPAGETSVTTDNASANTASVGDWYSSSSVEGFEGDDYLYHLDGVGNNTFTWMPPIAEGGTYQVFATWTSHSNRASDAKYTIQTVNGDVTVSRDQRSGGGSWQSLGTYELNVGFSISLSDDADGTVIADAVKVAKLGQ